MATDVSKPSPQVAEASKDRELLEHLMGGTREMREAQTKHMPKWPGEDSESYKARIETATLFPAYKRTVRVMASKPFSKVISYSDDMPEEMVAWLDDADREGVNLHAFAQDMFTEAFYGLAGILVEAPKWEGEGDRPVTIAAQKEAGMRPYLVRVRAEQILGWKTDKIGGRRVLTQLRIEECALVNDGEFGVVERERVRVLEIGTWRLFEKQKVEGKDVWVEIESGVTDLNYIPFVPVYGDRVDFMCGAPPLLDLAHLNVKHWQSQSDQDTILHVARVPILAISGGDAKAELKLGAMAAVHLPAGAEMKFVEHTGAAIDAGAKSLEALEEQMIQAGAELLVKRDGNRTATETATDAEANKCDLQRMAEAFEDALDLALEYMADIGGLAAAGTVTLYKDFGISQRTMNALLEMRKSGDISRETLWQCAVERGELPSSFNVDVEKERLSAEAI